MNPVDAVPRRVYHPLLLQCRCLTTGGSIKHPLSRPVNHRRELGPPEVFGFLALSPIPATGGPTTSADKWRCVLVVRPPVEDLEPIVSPALGAGCTRVCGVRHIYCLTQLLDHIEPIATRHHALHVGNHVSRDDGEPPGVQPDLLILALAELDVLLTRSVPALADELEEPGVVWHLPEPLA
jgi:hypothetical protein